MFEGTGKRHQARWWWFGVFMILTTVIVTPLLLWESSCRDGSTERPLNRTRRNTKKSTDSCIHAYGGIEIDYTLGTTEGFQFDLCSVIDCGGKDPQWRGYDAYLCMHTNPHRWCPTWNFVLQWTGVKWSPTPCPANTFCIRDKIQFERAGVNNSPSNPLLLTLKGLTQNPLTNHPCDEGPGHFYFILGVDVTGKDPMGLVRVNLLRPPASNATPTATPTQDHRQSERVRKIDFSKLSRTDVISLATGYGDKNLWLEWIAATATSLNMSDCIACSSARPTLFTTPAPLFPKSDPVGFHCMLALTMAAHPPDCTTLSAIFPPVKNSTIPPAFTPKPNNYTCFTRNSSYPIGHIPSDWCAYTIDVDSWKNASSMVWGRADLFWFCGDRTLHISLPPKWSGRCAMVRLGLPLLLMGPRPHPVFRGHRSTDTFDLGHGSPTYIDAIGVPRGVPDEFKLVDQVAAGFENIPIIAALFPVTPNKNVDRINYIHYNILRLSNKTRDAVAGLSEQLAATSLMTIQNRQALDMLLAEKGGVCAMFGDQCCTFIPNNTAPDGSVTRALEGLRALSDEMHEHSGISNPLGGVLGNWFGKWKGLFVSVFLSLVGMMTALILCGCCCIPCIRSLFERLIVTAIEKKGPPPPYQMTLLTEETAALLDRGVGEGPCAALASEHDL